MRVFTLGPAKILIIAMTLLLATPLWAQRYQGRDHHVFHPPAQAKHQSTPSAVSATPTRVATNGNPASSRRHDANPNASRSNDPAHPQAPSSTDTVHPH